MEVKIPKEIREYQETVFFGLSARQFVCSLLAVGAAVVGAAPFAACGFFKYHGMTAEKFIWAWFKSEFLYSKRLVFKSRNLYYLLLTDTMRKGDAHHQDVIQSAES